MKPSLEDFWPKFLELSPVALGFTCSILLPLSQHETNTTTTYKPVDDTNRPSRPPNSPKIAELIPSTELHQPVPKFS